MALRLARCMMTSSNGNIFRVSGFLWGEFTGDRWIPPQRPSTRSFDIVFDLYMNKRLGKQSWGWWVETPSRIMYHYNDLTRSCQPFWMMYQITKYVHVTSCHGNAIDCMAHTYIIYIYVCTLYRAVKTLDITMGGRRCLLRFWGRVRNWALTRGAIRS